MEKEELAISFNLEKCFSCFSVTFSVEMQLQQQSSPQLTVEGPKARDESAVINTEQRQESENLKECHDPVDAITSAEGTTAEMSRLSTSSFGQQPPQQQQQEQGEEQTLEQPQQKQKDSTATEQPYCVLPDREKIFFMLLCSFAAIISPISSSIYFPALGDLSEDLHVSSSLINLTITTYLVRKSLEQRR